MRWAETRTQRPVSGLNLRCGVGNSGAPLIRHPPTAGSSAPAASTGAKSTWRSFIRHRYLASCSTSTGSVSAVFSARRWSSSIHPGGSEVPRKPAMWARSWRWRVVWAAQLGGTEVHNVGIDVDGRPQPQPVHGGGHGGMSRRIGSVIPDRPDVGTDPDSVEHADRFDDGSSARQQVGVVADRLPDPTTGAAVGVGPRHRVGVLTGVGSGIDEVEFEEVVAGLDQSRRTGRRDTRGCPPGSHPAPNTGCPS